MKNREKSKGISLIILVITIIVIIILASAIIISLVNNNPISEANRARFESDRQNMQAIFTSTVAKIMVQNEGVVNIEPGRLNAVTSGEKNAVGEAYYTLPDSEGGKGTIIFDNGNNSKNVYYTGRKLPIYSQGETIWHVDDEGILTLQIGDRIYGEGNIDEGSVIKNILLKGNQDSVEVGVTTDKDTKIDKYVYYIREIGQEDWQTYESDSNQMVIDGLKEGTTYEVKVKVIGDEEAESKKREISTSSPVTPDNPDNPDTTEQKLIMKLNDQNGEAYVAGTWSKENVYLSIEGEEITYEATGANVVAQTSTSTVLSNEGTTTITVRIKGVVTNQYTVKIDKESPDGKIRKEIKQKNSEQADLIVSAVNVTDNLSDIKEYEFSLNGQQPIVSKNSSYTFGNLQNGEYQIKVVIIDNAGNRKELTRSVKVGFPDINDENTIIVEKQPTTWTNQNVKLKITFNAEDEYISQYSENGTAWTDVTKVYEKEIEENKTVYIRFVYHGETDTQGEVKEIVIDNIDKEEPTISSLTLSSEETSKNSKIIAKAIDNKSGIVAYLFSKSNTETENSSGWVAIPNTNTEITQEYIVNDNGTYYFYVKDAVGNISQKEIEVNAVDGKSPELQSLNVVSPESGVYKEGQIITIEATYSENIYGEVPQLNIKFGDGTSKIATPGSIAGNKITYTYTIESGDNGALVSTGYTGTVTDSAGNSLQVSNIGLGGSTISVDTSKPTNQMPQVVSNTNSITVILKQTDEVGIDKSTIKYAIKKSTDSEFGEWIPSNTESYTFTDLSMNETYEIKTMVSDMAGNIQESEIATIKTGNLTKPDISAPTGWTNENVIVTITYPDIPGTTKQYSTDGTNWTDTNLTVQTVSVSDNNTTVYARVVDTSNQTSGNSTYTVENIDKKAPEEFTPEVIADVDTIKVTATTTDEANETNGKSDIKNYSFSKDNGENWTVEQTSNTYTFSNLDSNTTYSIKVRVTDNAGNSVVSELIEIDTLNAIAKIGTTKYTSIQKAFDAVPNGTQTTVTMLQSTTEAPTIEASKNVILDLDNNTITGTITSSGAIEMQNGEVNGAIKLTGNNTDTFTNVNVTSSDMNTCFTIGENGVDIANQPTVNINGGNFRTYRNAIVTYGTVTIDGNPTMENELGVSLIYNESNATLTIKSGNYLSPNYACVRNCGTANIQGGSYTMTSEYDTEVGNWYAPLYNDQGGIMNITGGTITSSKAAIGSSGISLTISGNPQITSTGFYTIVNSGNSNLTINGGIINNTGTNSCVANMDTATANITAGTFESSTLSAFENLNSATANISGGTFKSTKNTIFNNGTKLTITGNPQITSTSTENYAIVMNYKELEIDGGTFNATSKAYGIYNRENGNTQVKSGTVTTNTNSALANTNNATMTVSGGTITSAQNTINNAGKKLTVTGNPQVSTTSTSGNVTLLNSKDAEINSGTFKTDTAYGIWNNTGGTTTINGGTITTKKVSIINEGVNLIISGSPQITSTESDNIQTTAGNLSISGGTFNAYVNPIYNCAANNTVNITGGTFTATTGMGVFNQPNEGNTVSGILKISGGTFNAAGIGIYTEGGSATLSGTTKVTTSKYATVRSKSGNLNVQGGTFTCNSTDGVSAIWSSDTATISGGTINSTTYGLINDGTSMTVSGTANVKVTGSNDGAYNRAGTLYIQGGTIASTGAQSCGIYVNANTTLRVSNGTINSSQYVGIYNNGIVYITGGNIYGKVYGMYKGTTGAASQTGGTINSTGP